MNAMASCCRGLTSLTDAVSDLAVRLPQTAHLLSLPHGIDHLAIVVVAESVS